MRVRVRNTGERPVDELVQVYAAAPGHRLVVPQRRLVAHHRRLSLGPAQATVVELEVPADALAVWDVTRGRFVVEPERYHARRTVVGLPSAEGRGRCRRRSVPPRPLRDTSIRALDPPDDRQDITFAERTRAAGTAVEATRGRRSGRLVFRDVYTTGVVGSR